MAKVEIAEPAKADIQEALDWWSENRSAIQAAEWYERIFEAITTLESMPERCPRVSESGLSRTEVRQLLFGIGSRPTHRVVFHFDVDADTVTILRVRHHGQDEL
jgi:plasmid stabilization system protein ParE